MTKPIAASLLAGAVLLCALPAAKADAWAGPLATDLIDGWTGSVTADANITGFGAWQSAHVSQSNITASIFAAPKLEKLFANEWKLGFTSVIDLHHDFYSGDNYNNRFFNKAYAYLSTPMGDVEMGQTDGAAYKMAITGPVVYGASALDDGNITFFRDPASGANFSSVFNTRTGVFASANDAKVSYYSPRLIGVQLGVSYTPALVAGVIPFADSAPKLANRQTGLVDAAVNYTANFGSTSLGLYAGVSTGHNAQRQAGFDDLTDWSFGGEADFDLGWTALAAGGAYRQSNAYLFSPYAAFAHGSTHAVHASAVLTQGKWTEGFEYSDTSASGTPGIAQLAATGTALTAGYEVNDNLLLTAGWQHQHLTTAPGAFYSGTGAVATDAVYFTAHVHI